MPDDTPIWLLGVRVVCSRCGYRGADVRPDWGPHVNKRQFCVLSNTRFALMARSEQIRTFIIIGLAILFFFLAIWLGIK